MSDVRDVRLLHRGVPTPLPSDGAPRGGLPSSVEERTRLAEFLDGALMRPLYFSQQQQRMRVDDALSTMSRAERVYLEIEMSERARASHSFDYDPLR